VRSLSWETVLHKFLQHESFPPGAVLHKLPQCWSFLQGAVLQEKAAPAWVPHEVTSPASKPAPAWAPLSTGPQVLAGACSSTGSPQGHSLLQASTCYGVRSLPRAAGGDLLHHGPPWAAGEQPASPWSSSQACSGFGCSRQQKRHAAAPPPAGVQRRMERKRQKQVGQDKGSLTEQQTEGTVTTMIQIRRKYDTNSHNTPSHPDRTGAARSSAASESLRTAPPTRTQCDVTWYGIPDSVWPGGVSPTPRQCPFLESGEN